MSKDFKFLSLILSLILCLSATAFGQRTTGSIEGTVTDPNGAVVPGVAVKVQSTGTTAGYNASTTTDENGFFQFAQIPVGTYELSTAATSGFQATRADVTVSIDRAAVINPKLTVGGGQNVVDVTADSSVTIDPTDTKVDTNITRQVAEALPRGTQFSSLLKVAPNVRPEPRAGGFQIDGASGSENVFVVDGQEVTNFRTGNLNSNFNLPFELVQEVQVKSTGYEAEYGGATGGVVNVVTQGGNDSWRGNFGISFRPGKIQGDRRVSLQSFTVPTSATSTVPLANLPGNIDYFQPPSDGGTDVFPVASVSGPIIKGRLWFSAIYAPQIFNTTRTIDYFANSIPGNSITNPNGRFLTETISYRQKQTQEEMFLRLDAQPTSRLRVYGTFLYNPIVQEGVLPGTTEGLTGSPQQATFGGSVGTLRGRDFLDQQGGRQNANAVNAQATWNPLNYLIINGRFGRSFLNEKLNSYGLPQSTRFICSAVSGGATPAQAGCNTGFQNFANNFQINYDASTRTTFDLDASLVGINLAGRHNFKFGYQYNKLFNTTDQGYVPFGIVQLFYDRNITQLGTPIAPTGATTLNPTGSCTNPNYVPGTPCNNGSGLLQRFGTIGEASSDNQALFVQDSWQILNRLTLNLGVRIENETVPNFGDTANTQAIKFGWGDKISPRIGVAFDLFGDGKTKIFANYGQYYDRFKYELPRGSFGGDFFRRDFFEILPGRGLTFSNYTFPAILGNNPDPIGGTCPITNSTGFSRCQFDFRIATNATTANIFETGAVDPDIKAARQSEYTFGVERQLFSNFLLSARYTHKEVDRAIEDIGVFNDQGSEAYIIGNPGLGLACEVATDANFPCAKAERKYDAFEIRLDRRVSKYFFNLSYTFSRLFGNYSGLASSDEITAGVGRSSPNVNRFFDLPPVGFTADGDPDNGRLATDRPHVFKAYGGYTFDWFGSNSNSTTVSAFTAIQSGTPLTTIYNLYGLGTTILTGRGDLGRTETYTETDLYVSHRYKFGRDNRLTFEPYISIRNLFDEKNVLGVQPNISNVTFTGVQLEAGGCTTCVVRNPNGSVNTSLTEAATFQTIFNGAGIRQYVLNYLSLPTTPQASRTLNTFGRANNFQDPREVRFGFRLFF